jgi:hypothetical protein
MPRPEPPIPRYALLVFALTAVHVALAATLPVSGDEAYYWDCSRHVDWSYFDQPPLVIWAMVPFRWLLGETALAVRSPAILSSLLLATFLPSLVRRLGGDLRDAGIAYLLMHAMPVYLFFTFYESTDAGMITAYFAATWAAVAIAQGERRAWWGFGIACGLGFLAKFPVVVVAPALVPALMRREVRAHLRTPTPYLAALLSVVLTGPVWVWGALHDWDNIAFQVAGRHGRGGGFPLQHVLEWLASNLAAATPFLLVAMAIALPRVWRGRDPAWRVMAVATAMPLLAFGLVSLRERVGAHWGAPALVVGIVAVAMVPFPWRRFLVRAGAVTGGTFALFLVVLAAVWSTAGPESLLGLPPLGDRSDEEIAGGSASYAFGDDEVVDELVSRLPDGGFAASESYTLVHLLGFKSRGELPTRLGNVAYGLHGLASLYWHRPEGMVDADVLFFTRKDGLGETVGALFETCDAEEPILVHRRGRLVRRLNVFRCRGLQEPVPAFTRLE